MKELGYYVNPAVFPMVPRGHGGIRFTVTRYNGLKQIESMLQALKNTRLEFLGETEIEIDLTDDPTSEVAPKSSGISSKSTND